MTRLTWLVKPLRLIRNLTLKQELSIIEIGMIRWRQWGWSDHRSIRRLWSKGKMRRERERKKLRLLHWLRQRSKLSHLQRRKRNNKLNQRYKSTCQRNQMLNWLRHYLKLNLKRLNKLIRMYFWKLLWYVIMLNMRLAWKILTLSLL